MHLRNNTQQGFSLGGFIMFCFSFSVVLLLAVRGIPVWVDYFKVSATLERLASNSRESVSNFRTPLDIREAFQKQVEIDEIKVITSHDLQIESSRETYKVTADYDVKVPLVQNVSLMVHFQKTVRILRRGG